MLIRSDEKSTFTISCLVFCIYENEMESVVALSFLEIGLHRSCEHDVTFWPKMCSFDRLHHRCNLCNPPIVITQMIMVGISKTGAHDWLAYLVTAISIWLTSWMVDDKLIVVSASTVSTLSFRASSEDETGKDAFVPAANLALRNHSSTKTSRSS